MAEASQQSVGRQIHRGRVGRQRVDLRAPGADGVVRQVGAEAHELIQCGWQRPEDGAWRESLSLSIEI